MNRTASSPDPLRRFRTLRTVAIVFAALGAIATLALSQVGSWWIGLIVILLALMIYKTARAELKRSTRTFEPLVYAGQLDVVGESHRIPGIGAIYRAVGQDELTPITALLIPEPTNRHDPSAIKVILQHGKIEQHVGYLPRNLATGLNPLITSYIERGVTPTALARIREFEDDEGETMFTISLATAN